MVNFKNTTFVKSVAQIDYKPRQLNKEIVFLGRSNVGKSSLINALTNNASLAKTSSKPGLTKLLNYFNVDQTFYLVDAPGYGYASGGVDLDALFAKLMNAYFSDNKELKGALLLIDSRRETNEMDKMMIDFLFHQNIPFLIVATKIDKTNQKGRHLIAKHLSQIGIEQQAIKFVSSFDKQSISQLQKDIVSLINA